MSATIIDGNATAKQIREEIAEDVKKLQAEKKITPGLAVVLVGDDPASHVYVRNKEKACENVGIYSRKIILPVDASEDELLGILDELNADDKIHGILVQLPLPKHIDETRLLGK